MALFLKTFGWDQFSVTVVELCSVKNLAVQEDWYLTKYQPMLNFLIKSYSDSRNIFLSNLTRSKISVTLKGRKATEKTKLKMSLSRIGVLNPFFGKGPGKIAIDKAAILKGKSVYVYDVISLTLVNDKPFRSIRETVKFMPISANSLSLKINTNNPFKGFYYYSYPKFK